MVHTSRSCTNALRPEIKRASGGEADGDSGARSHLGDSCDGFILERECSSFVSAALDLCSRQRCT
jgi:hypothetical protein